MNYKLFNHGDGSLYLQVKEPSRQSLKIYPIIQNDDKDGQQAYNKALQILLCPAVMDVRSIAEVEQTQHRRNQCIVVKNRHVLVVPCNYRQCNIVNYIQCKQILFHTFNSYLCCLQHTNLSCAESRHLSS